MAKITINEVSSTYTYNIGTNSFAAVALPITSSWGPAFLDPASVGGTAETVVESTTWNLFPATQAGLERFVSTYRGPSSIYRIAKDYSYQMAMTLLTAGYDVLVCRLCPGSKASGTFTKSGTPAGSLAVTARYAGSFGNNLKVKLTYMTSQKCWDMVVYVTDSAGVQIALERLVFTLVLANASENVPHISEITSEYLTFATSGTLTDTATTFTSNVISLTGGSDMAAPLTTAALGITDAVAKAKERFTWAGNGSDYTASTSSTTNTYITALQGLSTTVDLSTAEVYRYKEWLYTFAYRVYDLLKDRWSYSPQRIISPWDDQNMSEVTGAPFMSRIAQLSPLHVKLMDTGYYSRCAASMIDIPKSLQKEFVFNETSGATEGYAQMLARYNPAAAIFDINASLYQTHSALFAPWGRYTYVGMSTQVAATPSFIALMLQRAMLLNQPTQYEWALPSDRHHNLRIGKLDYKVPLKLINSWQSTEGVGVNVIADLPDTGITLWGNSTLFEVPPATYQALANLSTRYLMNAVKNLAYKCSLAITWQYNNSQAYNKFYAGITPLLDNMRNAGAIDDYYVKMSQDLDALDQVKANSVVGKVYLVVAGVVSDITIDLIALPPGTSLAQFQS